VTGVGENLVFKSNAFDLVFCVNALDHSEIPDKLLNNIEYALKPEGILMLMVHVVTPMEKLAYIVFKFLRHTIKKPSIVSLSKKLIDFLSQRSFGLSVATDSYLHPHYFTINELISLVQNQGFAILYDAVDVSRFGFKDELFMALTKAKRQ
jgi:ubiquinone/menaquinone biosynthesis C-methylase UbiE